MKINIVIVYLVLITLIMKSQAKANPQDISLISVSALETVPTLHAEKAASPPAPTKTVKRIPLKNCFGQKLDADGELVNSLEALAQLMERYELPCEVPEGFSEHTPYQRLKWILKQTESCQLFGLTMNFKVKFNDRGLREDLRDGSLYEDEKSTNQIGHFLTAVGLADASWWNPGRIFAPAACTGHELIGDDQGPLKQGIAGLNPMDHLRFNWAVDAARKGEAEKAKDFSGQIMHSLPSDIEKFQNKRHGNSHQGMLLTIYGYAFCREVREGKLETRKDAADWLRENLGHK